MRTPFVLALLWCSLAFADRLVPELDAGRFGMLERELQLNREQTGMLRAARLAYVSELDLIREQRSAALSAAGAATSLALPLLRASTSGRTVHSHIFRTLLFFYIF